MGRRLALTARVGPERSPGPVGTDCFLQCRKALKIFLLYLLFLLCFVFFFSFKAHDVDSYVLGCSRSYYSTFAGN